MTEDDLDRLGNSDLFLGGVRRYSQGGRLCRWMVHPAVLRFGRPMPSDRQLSKRAAHGCKDSLRTIYESHKDHLLTLARALTGSRGDAEDVVHDVFVAFVRNLPALRLRTSLRAYLCVAVCNRVRDLARMRIRQGAGPNATDLGSDVPASPDVRAAEAELTERLRAALMMLPPEQREVVLLRSRSALPFKEIARCQGIGVNTAQARYRYGIDRLRSLMNSELEP